MLYPMLRRFLQAPRRTKQFIVVLSDYVMLFMACWMALSLRLGDIVEPMQKYWLPCLLVPLVSVPVMAKLGLYRAVIRYMGHMTLWLSFKAVVLSVLIWVAVLTLLDVPAPRSVFFIYGFIALTLIAGSRLYARWLIHRFSQGRQRQVRHEAVILYGAGEAGAQLASALIAARDLQPVAFVDDDPQKQGTEIAGLRVHSPEELPDLIERFGVDSVLLAISALTRAERRRLVDRISFYPVAVKVLPGVSELASGDISVNDIREVDVIDLLGRDAVEPVPELMGACITGKTVMVTGAGGSIGSELCRQIVQQQPATLVLFELSEYALYSIEAELKQQIEHQGLTLTLVPILGSVTDRGHLTQVMQCFSVNTVYHAAAYKHVPMVEYNMAAGVRNNVVGTWATATAALNAGVEHFVLISTDKAVRPTNVMGATKRVAELVLQALSQSDAGKKTRFVMVRFGNVLGSSGSVIPLFRRQIEQGGPVTVTHPEITRYFMTIPEAAALVLQAGSMGEGGDVFVLDMGSPVRIADLAREMIVLAGLSVRDELHPEGDIEILYTGLRPGEKLYEELLIGENVSKTEHPMIMRAEEESLAWGELEPVLVEIQSHCENGEALPIRDLLQRLVSGYQPRGEVVDLLVSSVFANEEKLSLVQSKTTR
ncbi:polysaccharide biosynthesis protein [Marinobacterium stanieri]|uniref:polysaccharide biosynthesis protein n=1 Tax=Marinobacterium stanieri TaxID=49186 RepID=UPI003A93A1A9